MFPKIKSPLVLTLLGSVFLGVYLWLSSDLPPFGRPVNEYNINFWGLLANIAGKWRSLQLDWWDRGMAGGSSIFLMGHYPIFNPFNIMAWFLNDDKLLLFMMIMPYVLGFFLTSLVLLDRFKLRWPYAFFGALNYLGLNIGSHASLVEQPPFLFGSMLFPGMVYCYLKLQEKDKYLAMAAVGSLVALQFAMGGLLQFFQVILWWIIFLCIEFFFRSDKGLKFLDIKKFFGVAIIFFIMSIGILGIQVIPTIYYGLTDSARTPTSSYYPINNFSLPEFMTVIHRGFLSGGPLSAKGILALIICSLGLFLSNPSSALKNIINKNFLIQIWIATAIYFFIPTISEVLANQLPVIQHLFSPLTTLNFKYGTHILDFCITLSLCLILGSEDLDVSRIKSPFFRILGLTLWSIALLLFILPVLLSINFDKPVVSFAPYLDNFVPIQKSKALPYCFIGIIILSNLIHRRKNKYFLVVFSVALMTLGFMRAKYSYDKYEKGKRINVAAFYFDSPEMQYFMKAKGQYFLPYNLMFHTTVGDRAMWTMQFNYNLIYGVHGTLGVEPLRPIRFLKFTLQHQIFNNPHWNKITKISSTLLNRLEARPSQYFATYFPVDFTTTKRGEDLPWEGFRKEVSGQFQDIWVRKNKVQRVRFAKSLSCTKLDEIVRKFNQASFVDHIFVESQDCTDFGLRPLVLDTSRFSSYSNFIQKRGDHIQFDLVIPSDTFVVVPEMYQRGWKVKANGQPLKIFPANYLFIGFQLPKGEYTMELKYLPPQIEMGVLASLASLLVFVFLIRKSRHS